MIPGLVHIIDDDLAVRQSLALLLDAADLSARAYPDAESFLAAADAADLPGCVVADMRMPGMSGLDLLAAIRDRRLDLPLIVITGHADVAMAVLALKSGAADFIEKPFDEEVFLGSVRQALVQGQRAFHERREAAAIAARAAGLTPREREVMALVVRGLPNKMVAAELAISVRTVEIHRARVMEKMGADSLSGLVRTVLQLDDTVCD